MTVDNAAIQTQSETSSLQPGRAWLVLLGASLCIFGGNAAVPYYTFGVFLPEILADTGWSGPAVAAAVGPGLLAAAVMAPLAGMASDRFGVRSIILFGAPAIAFGFAVLGLFTSGVNSFVAATILAHVLYFAGSPVPHARMLAGWFDKRRGLALSTMFASGSIGIAIWPQYAALLIEHLGWRHAYVTMGLSAACLILFAGIFLLKDPRRAPASMEATPSNAVPGLLLGEALRTSRFWKLCAIFLVLTAVLGGTAVVFPVILRMQGADPATAASIMSVIGIAMFVGRLALGLLLDRWFAPLITIGITLIGMMAFAIMAVSTSSPALILSAAFLGFGLGSEYAVTAYLTSRAFGVRAFGSIYGLITAATSVGAALGPALLGAALVSSVSLGTIAAVALGVLGVPIILLLTISRNDLPFQQ